MKKIFSLIIAAVVVVSAQAQIYSSRSVNTESSNYDRIYASYSSYGLSPKEGDGDSYSGFRLGWLKGISVMSEQPLFVEVGVNGQYNAKAEDGATARFLKFAVPVSVAYKYALSDNFRIVPHTGIHLGVNAMGEYDYGSHSVSFFDGDEGASRVQFGWQIGAGFEFKKLYVGFEYSLDFNKYVEGVSTHDIYATLGINF